MDTTFRTELAAMQQAHDRFEPLTEAGRRRAVVWLAAKLNVDLTGYHYEIAREVAAAAR